MKYLIYYLLAVLSKAALLQEVVVIQTLLHHFKVDGLVIGHDDRSPGLPQSLQLLLLVGIFCLFGEGCLRLGVAFTFLFFFVYLLES